MRKMGWREGEGLGKNKEGNKEPILVDFKTDRKGNTFWGKVYYNPFTLSGLITVSTTYSLLCDPALQALCLYSCWLGRGVV